MKLFFNGNLYETTDATRPSYVFRYFSERLLRKLYEIKFDYDYRIRFNYIVNLMSKDPNNEALVDSKTKKVHKEVLKSNFLRYGGKNYKAKISQVRQGDIDDSSDFKLVESGRSDKRFDKIYAEYISGNIKISDYFDVITSNGTIHKASIPMKKLFGPSDIKGDLKDYYVLEGMKLLERFNKTGSFGDDYNVARSHGIEAKVEVGEFDKSNTAPIIKHLEEQYAKEKPTLMNLFVNNGNLVLNTATVHGCIAEESSTCARMRLHRKNYGRYDIEVPFFDADLKTISSISYNQANASEYLTHFEHEISHAYDLIILDDLEEYLDKDSDDLFDNVYYSRITEIKAYMQNYFGYIEKRLRNNMHNKKEMKRELISAYNNKDSESIKFYKDIIRQNYDSNYAMYYSKDSFVRFFMRDSEIEEASRLVSGIKRIMDKARSLSVSGDDRMINLIKEILGNYYIDLMSRYNNVISK